MKYFISFIEECIQNPLYVDYIGGRIEVFEQDAPYPCKEIRFFTKDVGKFKAFRYYWDMKNVTDKKLREIEKRVKGDFYKFPKK